MNIEGRANEESREQKQSFFGGAFGGALLLFKESIICRPLQNRHKMHPPRDVVDISPTS